MRWNLFQSIATAALALTASANVVVPRQQKFVGYLITTFSDPVPRVQQYLSNGNNPFSYRKLNNGNPILTSTVGTRAVRDVYLVTNTDRSEYFQGCNPLHWIHAWIHDPFHEAGGLVDYVIHPFHLKRSWSGWSGFEVEWVRGSLPS